MKASHDNPNIGYHSRIVSSESNSGTIYKFYSWTDSGNEFTGNFPNLKEGFLAEQNWQIEIGILIPKKKKELNQQNIKVAKINESPEQLKIKSLKRRYYRYRSYDKKYYPNTPIDLTLVQFLELFKNAECHYCGTKADLGFDRIQNDKGHASYNSVISCRSCNIERADNFSVVEFRKCFLSWKKFNLTDIENKAIRLHFVSKMRSRNPLMRIREQERIEAVQSLITTHLGDQKENKITKSEYYKICRHFISFLYPIDETYK